MGTNEKNLGGRFFYEAKGLRGLEYEVERDTRISLRVLAEKLNKPIYQTVELILDHYLENPDLYETNNFPAQNGSLIAMTAFVQPEIHKRMKIKKIYAEMSLKSLTGWVIHQYITKHCKANLGDEDGNQR